MNELGHDASLRRPARASRRAGSATRSPLRQSRLAESLREARQDRGLELRDVSVITGVRMSYLEALEAGDYGRLPEDAKGKNALRLFARAVGLDPARMLLLYAQERRGVYAPPPELELPRDDARPPRPVWGRLGRWLATLALIAATLGAALWVFNTLLFPPAGTPAPQATLNAPMEAPRSPSAAPGTVDLATADVPVRPPPTTPPAAEPAEAPAPQVEALPTDVPPAAVAPSTTGPTVTDPTAITPATSAPTPNAAPLEADAALDAPANDAEPVAEEPAAPANAQAAAQADAQTNGQLSEPINGQTAQAEAPAPETAPPTVTINVTAPAWLEVYTGGARREGERLVYRLAEPGETLTFEGPVFIFTGNAGGVAVSVGGGPAEPLGAPSRVVGRVFPAESP
ncbi:helix-turn-helix domain-containing protein [Truepera radiovictrix]|uniref:Cytoskeleton protein RodZ-like C-terminal domain-containing protein n=1 Tax=Truepera radiovictrix (strain DSM 17093 / CIP 108686 / LMG 22925 / RQ-24) TaxID=649638 RepID=D7CQW8_TRURR|nr:RodZ domain-containing protein [Truepera radiovictrix]ADI15102.1 conserved hypothetical protein [Truepera radiovictrix DSM 17093]WMT56345.1 DUF4115 domain-containing protein [Truepera radiovictrix]